MSMHVNCAECGKANTLDGNFCRSCGHALSGSALDSARAELATFVRAGFELLSEGKADEALLVAQSGLDADPTSLDALTLKADALERLGDLAGSIEAYERVVEARPDAALERIKLQHARRLLSERAVPASPPPRHAALGAALSASILMASLGVGSAWWWNASRSAPVEVASPTDNLPVGAIPVGAGQPAREVSREEWERAQRAAVSTERPRSPSASQAEPTRTTSPRAEPNLPESRPNGRTEAMPGNVAPMRPELTLTPIEPARNPGASPPANPQPSQDPDPAPVNQPRPEPRRQGTVDIRPSPSNPQRSGGSQTLPDPTERASGTARDHLTLARQAMNAGEYAKAAEAFERALQLGADPGTTNQRLGQAYARLGKNSQAIQAYERAAAVFESRAAGDPAAAAALDACREAIRALRG